MQPLQRESSYKNTHLYLCRQGNEPYHEKLPSRCHGPVRAAPCSHLSLPGSVEHRACMGLGFPPQCTDRDGSCHSWQMLLWKLSYPETMSAQKEATGMCLNKHTCIFLVLGAAVNSLAKKMDEFISFQISPLSNQRAKYFSSTWALILQVFLLEKLCLWVEVWKSDIKERKCMWAAGTIILWVIWVCC